MPAGLWAGSDPVPAAIEAGWLPADHPFAIRTDTSIVNALLDTPADANSRTLLPLLISCTDIKRLDAVTARRLRKVFDQEHFEEAFEPDAPATGRVLETWALLTAMQGDSAAIQDVLVRQACRCSRNWPDTKLRFDAHGVPTSIALSQMIEAACTHSLALPGTLPEQIVIFAQCVRLIAGNWPGCSRAAVAQLDAVLCHMDAHAAGEAWWVVLARTSWTPLTRASHSNTCDRKPIGNVWSTSPAKGQPKAPWRFPEAPLVLSSADELETWRAWINAAIIREADTVNLGNGSVSSIRVTFG